MELLLSQFVKKNINLFDETLLKELDKFLEDSGFECYDRIYVAERNWKLVDCEYRNVNSTTDKTGPRWNSN